MKREAWLYAFENEILGCHFSIVMMKKMVHSSLALNSRFSFNLVDSKRYWNVLVTTLHTHFDINLKLKTLFHFRSKPDCEYVSSFFMNFALDRLSFSFSFHISLKSANFKRSPFLWCQCDKLGPEVTVICVCDSINRN